MERRPAGGGGRGTQQRHLCGLLQVKSYLRHQDFVSVDKAVKYTEWREADGKSVQVVSNNDYLASPAHHKSLRTVLALARGGKCFNASYYAAHNPYIPPNADWKHYALWGQFQGVKAQFSCEPDYTQVEAFLNEET
jgi:hypothetical protein